MLENELIKIRKRSQQKHDNYIFMFVYHTQSVLLKAGLKNTAHKHFLASMTVIRKFKSCYFFRTNFLL